MTNKFITALCACLLFITALAFGIHAEEYEDVPVEAPPRRLSRHLRRKLRRLLRKMLRVYLWRSTLTHWLKL